MHTEQLKPGILKVDGYEKVIWAEDKSSGLSAIISIHNSNLGPACGGIRLLPYPSRDEALQDVLRLSKGMSYKSALAGIKFGGGKSVIIADPKDKSPELFRAFGDFVESLGGAYIAAKDMNIDSNDLLTVKSRTKHVLGIQGEKGSGGDPSPVTARGLFRSVEATAEHLFGRKDLKGVTVAVQGIGYVGYPFAEAVQNAGGKLIVSDINPESLEKAKRELNATVVEGDAIYTVECDIFSPCARGGILNSKVIPQLKCKAVVGAANNQLLTEQDGHTLFKRGIVYAPDYMVNAGGIINVYVEFESKPYNEARALGMADHLYDTTKTVLERAKKEGRPPFLVADALAEERMRAGT